MLFSSLLFLVPFLASGIFSAPVAFPYEGSELTIKWKRDVNLDQLPQAVSSQLKALGIDGTKGTFYVNGEEVQPEKRDLSGIEEALERRASPVDEAYELIIRF
ncbi:hypothetical protein MMC21_004644 [Puttea exsequens]|nr:hypothetical protein [Puttea exsequens]